jgi:hypothetical protein
MHTDSKDLDLTKSVNISMVRKTMNQINSGNKDDEEEIVLSPDRTIVADGPFTPRREGSPDASSLERQTNTIDDMVMSSARSTYTYGTMGSKKKKKKKKKRPKGSKKTKEIPENEELIVIPEEAVDVPGDGHQKKYKENDFDDLIR